MNLKNNKLEMTSKEIYQMAMYEIPYDFICGFTGLTGEREYMILKAASQGKLIKMCAQWKNKELKTEWFWQGRIYKAEDDKRFFQSSMEVIYDTGCENRESAEDFIADKLKEYCRTHDGSYMAVVEHVCRIKK